MNAGTGFLREDGDLAARPVDDGYRIKLGIATAGGEHVAVGAPGDVIGHVTDRHVEGLLPGFGVPHPDRPVIERGRDQPSVRVCIERDDPGAEGRERLA